MNHNATNEETEVIGAIVEGSPKYPNVHGIVIFRLVEKGTLIEVMFEGLPEFVPATKTHLQVGPFALNINENGVCDVVDPQLPFITAGYHFNPTNQPHGNSAGDLPNVYSNHGYAWMSIFTDKFKPEDVLNRSVVIRENPDNYLMEPSGFALPRMGCGVIKRMKI